MTMWKRHLTLVLVLLAFTAGCLEGWNADVRAWSETITAKCPNHYRQGHEREYDQCIP